MTDPNCLFCRIVAGEIPSEKVYEDEHTLAFLDIHPINGGHTLVVPKDHHANISDTPKETFARVMETVRTLTPKIARAVGAHGMNIHINSDVAAGQVIFHLHVHIIPRFDGDGYLQWHGNPYQDGKIKTIQDAILREAK